MTDKDSIDKPHVATLDALDAPDAWGRLRLPAMLSLPRHWVGKASAYDASALLPTFCILASFCHELYKKYMSIDRVRTQLEKFGLASANDENDEMDEMSVSVRPISPYYLFTDSSGDRMLIARVDDVNRILSDISMSMGSLNKDSFWGGNWLGSAPVYHNLDGLWASLEAVTYTISVSVPRSSEKTGIGRAKRLNKDLWLFESEEGEYGLVPDRDTKKWHKE